jgi:hypothetical protein
LISAFLFITHQNKHLANETIDGSCPKPVFMVDWLIVGRCTFSGQYFMQTQDENKFNKKVCKNNGLFYFCISFFLYLLKMATDTKLFSSKQSLL